MGATSEIRITADASQAIAEVRSLRAEVEQLRAELDRARSPRVQILHEPLTYGAQLVRGAGDDPRGLHAIPSRENRSYIQDFVLATVNGNQEARARLNQHAKEMRKIGEDREKRFAEGASYTFEERAVSWTNGAGGYFAPPLWIVEQFAIQPTPERVLSRLAPQFALPEGAQSVNIPAFTTGPNVRSTQVDAPPLTSPDADTAVSSAVVTIAGNFDVPMQMLEQSPQGAHLDWVAFTSMEARYGYELELQLLNGYGSNAPQGSGNNQLVGILNNTAIPTANNIVYTDGSPTGVKLIQVQGSLTAGGAIPQAVAAVGKRFLPPQYWMMTTSRGAWIASSETSMLPVAVSNQTGPGKFDLLAYPVELNDAIPTSLGPTATQDSIFCVRPDDWLVLESERRSSVFTDVLSGTLQARLQMRRYAASLLRQPSSVAYITGTGMIVQTTLGF